MLLSRPNTHCSCREGSTARTDPIAIDAEDEVLSPVYLLDLDSKPHAGWAERTAASMHNLVSWGDEDNGIRAGVIDRPSPRHEAGSGFCEPLRSGHQ